MTLEEAKKLLKKEGFVLTKVDYESFPSDAFTKYESPDVVEAMKIVQKASYSIGMVLDEFDARKARLKKEYEAKTTAPGGESPAIKESAKLFNDALLDEQAKKIFKQSREIDELKMRNMALDELSASRNKIIVKQSKKISKLRKVIRDKDAVLSDVSEELRLSKVREDKLTEVCQKYLKEIEGLKNQLHDLQQKHFALMDERDQTVGELKAKIRNLKKPRIPTPEETKPYPAEDNPEDANPKYNIYVEDWVWKALGKERKKPTEDDIMEGCKEMMRMNIKLMRDLLGE